MTRLLDPAGQTWTYGYNSNGMLNGTRYSTYVDNASKRVQESGLTGGDVKDTFTYGTNSTTVVSATGQSVTYTFASVQGGLKLTGTSRTATTTCPVAAAQTVYDPNGWIDYTLDWNGNKTDFTYDSAGMLQQVTAAAGTTIAGSKINSWSGESLTSTKFLDSANNAYAQVTYTYVPSSGGFAYGKLSTETWSDLRTGAQRQTLYGYTFHVSGVMSRMTVTRTLPSGSATTTYNYDTQGNLTSMRNPLGHVVTWSGYNGFGYPGRMITSDATTDYGYDARGNRTSVQQYLPGGTRVATFAYDGSSRLTDALDSTGRADRYRYNAGGRLQSQGDAAGQYVQFAFDIAANTMTTSSTRHVPTLSGQTPVATTSGQFSAKRKSTAWAGRWSTPATTASRSRTPTTRTAT